MATAKKVKDYRPTPGLDLGNGIYKTKIDGLYYIEHQVHEDARGFYTELSRIPEINSVIGFNFIVQQVNQAHSVTNVLRGFHAEGWNKLITITAGKAVSVLVDLRPTSRTFLKQQRFSLGFGADALSGSLFISSGIANSVCVVEGPVDYLYCVDRLYKDRDESGDKAISLFDPDLAVRWPIPKNKMIISERDSQAISLREMFPENFS